VELLDLTLPTAAENLALDEALLEECEAGRTGNLLRLWELPAYAAVLGSASVRAAEVRMAELQADGVPLLRRISGGGTVILGPGCLCFSLFLGLDQPGLQEVRGSYCLILGKLAKVLSAHVPGVACAGTSDLAVHGRKFSGNSQRRLRRYLLHHGTLLYDFDLSRLPRWLHPPPRQPHYRACRDHLDFVTNLPLSRIHLRVLLAQAFPVMQQRTNWPAHLVQRLTVQKHSHPSWIERR